VKRWDTAALEGDLNRREPGGFFPDKAICGDEFWISPAVGGSYHYRESIRPSAGLHSTAGSELERPSRRVGDKRQFEGSLLALCLQHQEPNEAAAL
jgi:hypothetical protein